MDKWTDRLSEYLDGELTLQENEALEAHLLECADCGQTLQQLRGVVARAQQVLDAPPTNDLWTGIANRIEGEKALELSSSQALKLPSSRRLSFSVTQLVAASIVLMLLSAGSVYLMLTRNTAAPIAASTETRQSRDNVRQVADKPVLENYNFAISELEGALKSNRSQLDTTTVRVLENNLHTIDRAILDARAALARDPGNTYLNRYLDETVQKKIQLLRRATSIVRAQT